MFQYLYLFLIVPTALTGLMLVLLLFLLTVTEGTINIFILYVNITGINASMLFQIYTPVYTLTSLDLDIWMCFYSGMDDFIFIATSLIITSCYSTTIQRLTARRALYIYQYLLHYSYCPILKLQCPLCCSPIPPSLNYLVNSL